MGRGQRHSKNAGGYGTEAFTYAERKALGFGTIHERLGKVCCVVCAAVYRAPPLGSRRSGFESVVFTGSAACGSARAVRAATSA